MMILRRTLRYNGINLTYFAESLMLVERLISAELMNQGSFLKFIFQFGDIWYYIKRTSAEGKNFEMKELLTDGFWDFSNEVFC